MTRLREKGQSYTGSIGPVRGKALQASTVIVVQWPWLSLLATQLVLAIVFLVGTVVATHGSSVQIVKSSSIATLCVLDESAKSQLGPVGDLKELAANAGLVKVKLERQGSLKLVDVSGKV